MEEALFDLIFDAARSEQSCVMLVGLTKVAHQAMPWPGPADATATTRRQEEGRVFFKPCSYSLYRGGTNDTFQ